MITKRCLAIGIAMLGQCMGALAQQPAKLEVKIALIDAELNPKPVPKLTLNIEPGSIVVATGFDGIAHVELPAGSYRLTTPKPAIFLGKQFTWTKSFIISSAGLQIELSNDNATVIEAEKPKQAPAGDDLTALFKRLKPTVVTVLAEIGRAQGTGFIIDESGLVVTNEHVVGHSSYIAVQFDPQHKLPAVLLASDAQKDIAILRVNLAPVRPLIAIAQLEMNLPGAPPLEEGTRVFTIGNPLSKEKILTSGIVSKVSAHSILSDININPGNSGGPLFDPKGEVIGITTFGESGGLGPGVSGIVRIESALPLIAQAKAKLTTSPPSAKLLPVDPVQPFPMDALKAVLSADKFDYRPYRLSAGDFDVELVTPISSFRSDEEDRLRAERGRQKRNKQQPAPPSSGESEHLRDWASDSERYKAIITVYIFPKLKETKGSMWGRLLATNMPATKRFKADFYSLKLMCGSKEIEPIFPGRVKVDLDAHNRAVNIEDSAFFGVYSYDPNSIAPQCGQVSLQVTQSQGAQPELSKQLEAATVEKVWQDFEPFRRAGSTSPNPARP